MNVVDRASELMSMYVEMGKELIFDRLEAELKHLELRFLEQFKREIGPESSIESWEDFARNIKKLHQLKVTLHLLSTVAVRRPNP